MNLNANSAESRKEQALDSFQTDVDRLTSELGKVIIGQQEVIRQILIALFVGGHCILKGVPGLAKTLLIKTVAQALELKFNRVQFTPDLMPSNIIGTEVIEEDRTTGKRVVRFIPGPIFANIILADEINRTPPKTQAALLEAMQEYQVTVNGVRYALERPLFVLATQNPIEQEGTYSLPEAQLDRFLFNIVIDYPSYIEEQEILSTTTSSVDYTVQKVIDGEKLLLLHEVVRDVPAPKNIVEYVTKLIRATRPGTPDALPYTNEWVRWGAGPRAGQALLLGAKAMALFDGRLAVSFDDILAIAHPVLRHRLIPNFHAEAEGITSDAIVDKLFTLIPQSR